MSNCIEFRLCDEDRARLDKIIEGLGNMRPNCANCVDSALAVMSENLKAVQESEHPVDAVAPHADPEPAAEPELPQFTKADVLAKVQQLAAPNNPKREQAKAIVKTYGAKVSDIPEDKYAEVMAKLAELEG